MENLALKTESGHIAKAIWRVYNRGAFDSAKNHKRQSVTAEREKSRTPKFV